MLQDSQIPTQRYQFSSSNGQYKRGSTAGVAFIKGPLSVEWLSCAASLPGKAINVALALLWLNGIAQSGGIKMTRKTLERFCISRDAYLDALHLLESAGLIDVQRLAGQTPIVKIRSMGENQGS
jgi:hypothetical protein